MHLLHLLIQNGRLRNSKCLPESYTADLRTFRRDIEFMKDSFRLPIAFDAAKGGYHYTEPVPHFPPYPISEAEAFALFIASKVIEQYRGTPFHQLLGSAFERLTSYLDPEARFSLGSLDDRLSFRSFAPGDADIQAFQKLALAVRGRRVVNFLYRNHGAQACLPRRVQPYHIAHVEGRWCLFGFDLDRQAMRTFLLCRLQDPVLARDKFATPKFDLNEYLRNSFTLFRGKAEDDYDVVVDFDAWAADEVRDRRWHASQELTEVSKGTLRISMRLGSLEEVEKWILGFGVHATVVRPKALAERIRKVGEELVRRYSEPTTG